MSEREEPPRLNGVGEKEDGRLRLDACIIDSELWLRRRPDSGVGYAAAGLIFKGEGLRAGVLEL